MMILKKISIIFDTMMDRIFSVLGAAIFSQIPNLILLYINTLSGALAESTRQVAAIQRQASLIGLTMEGFITQHLKSAQPAFKASGKIHQATLLRYQEYKGALHALNESEIWNRPFIFIQHLDFAILKAVKFKPAIPLNLEGLIYALIGIILGLILYHGIIKIPFRIFRKKTG